MNNHPQTPEENREKARHEELTNKPTGALKDGFDRAENVHLADLAGGLGWKGTGILIVVLIIGYVVYKLFL